MIDWPGWVEKFTLPVAMLAVATVILWKFVGATLDRVFKLYEARLAALERRLVADEARISALETQRDELVMRLLPNIAAARGETSP